MGTSPRTGTAQVLMTGPMSRILGMSGGRQGAMPFFIVSPSLAVNASATGHFCVPCDATIVAARYRVLTQQTTAGGTLQIGKNGTATAIGTKAVATADTAGTLVDLTIAASGDIDTATDKHLLTSGDVVHFSTANTGAAGVVAAVLVCVPR